MADSPIVFSAPMIRALLEGRKTQTRRIMPHQDWLAQAYSPIVSGNAIFNYAGEEEVSRARFAVGDRLWVREAHAISANPDLPVWYRSGHEEASASGPRVDVKWRSSIHMPRWTSRLTLIVIGVKVERLQDISATDAEAEGVPTHVAEHTFAKVYRDPAEREATRVKYFRELWEKLYGADSWAANPWVAAITFRVVKANIAQIEASP